MKEPFQFQAAGLNHLAAVGIFSPPAAQIQNRNVPGPKVWTKLNESSSVANFFSLPFSWSLGVRVGDDTTGKRGHNLPPPGHRDQTSRIFLHSGL